jgi:replicative DNA helicase
VKKPRTTRTPSDAASDAGRALVATTIAMTTIPAPAQKLAADDFIEEAQRVAWRLCLGLADEGKQITPHALAMLAAQQRVTERLPDGGAAGWAESLAREHAVVPAQVPQLVAIVTAQAQRRQIERAATEVLTSAQRGRPVEELRAALQVAAAEVKAPTETAAEEPKITLRLASGMVHEVFSKPLPPPIATPFPQLDLLLGGGLRGVNILAGPTGRGKSGWALAQARLTARTRPVVYLSTELDERQALARVAAQEVGKPWRALYEGDATTEATVAGAVEGLRLYVMTIGSVGQMLDAFAALALCEPEPSLVVLDYLQGLARTAEDRRLAVGCVSEAVTAWTRTTGGVVLAVSSISRANYFGTDEKSATDFVNAAKESGDVEFDAASVMFLDVAAPPLGGASEGRLHIAKARFGSAGTIGLFFDGPSGTFQADPAGGLTVDQRAVLEAVQDGARTWDEIGKAAGLRRNKIGPCLRALQARNLTDGQNRPLTSAGPKPRQNGPTDTTLPGTSSQSVPGRALVLPFPSVSAVPCPGTGAAAFPVSSPPYRGELGTAELGNRTDPGKDTL